MSTEESGNKGDIIQANTTIYVLQQRIDVIEKELESEKTKHKATTKTVEEQKNRYEDILSHIRKQLKHVEDARNRAEEENTRIKEQLINSQIKSKKDIEELNDRTLREIRDLKDQILSRDAKIESILKFKTEKEGFVLEIKRLKEELDRERHDKDSAVKGKEREMFEAKEKLQKEMRLKIKETKVNLMALNDEQLHATTRLTILQNHQLTTELEYQSKQTEKLLLKNTKLEEQLISQKRDIEIHKQVEAELAKRSNLSQQVIKKLNDKLKKYEQNPSVSREEGSIIKEAKSKEPNDELISFLEAKLEESEKKYAAFNNDYEVLHADYVKLQKLIEKMKDKYSKAALLLTEFLDNILTSSPNLLQEEKNLYLDIERLKTVDFNELEKEEKAALTLVLLKQLQPYLSDINLEVHRAKEGEGFHKFLDNVNVQKQNPTPDTTEKVSKKTENISMDRSALLPSIPLGGKSPEEEGRRYMGFKSKHKKVFGLGGYSMNNRRKIK